MGTGGGDGGGEGAHGGRGDSLLIHRGLELGAHSGAQRPRLLQLKLQVESGSCGTKPSPAVPEHASVIRPTETPHLPWTPAAYWEPGIWHVVGRGAYMTHPSKPQVYDSFRGNSEVLWDPMRRDSGQCMLGFLPTLPRASLPFANFALSPFPEGKEVSALNSTMC